MINIQSKSLAHMVVQIRAKQLATESVQNELQKNIVEHWNSSTMMDKSDKQIAKEIQIHLSKYLKFSKALDELFCKQSTDTIGFPIKHNKTFLQLEMATKWAEKKERS